MKKILFGILMMLTGICILLTAMEIDVGFIGLFSIRELLLVALLLAFLIFFVFERAWSALPLPCAAAMLIFEKRFAALLGRAGEDLYSFWLIAGVTVLLCIGIGLCTDRATKRPSLKLKKFTVKHNGKAHSGSLSSDTRYIDCAHFTEYYYRIRLGDGNVYFENPEQYTGNGTLTLDCELGNITVNVPKAFSVQCSIANELGNVDCPERSADGPVLNITGRNKLGNISISYCD